MSGHHGNFLWETNGGGTAFSLSGDPSYTDPMTYYGPKELAAAFRTVRDNTIQVAEDIPEAHYGHRITPESRSVAETLAHIAVAPRFYEQVHFVENRSTMAGFDFFAFMAKQMAEVEAPRTKSQVLDFLRSEGERFAQELEGASEDFLAELVQLPEGAMPPSKTRFEMLMGAKEHEMHHRAQLMMVERMLGITPHLTRRMQERVAAMQGSQAGR